MRAICNTLGEHLACGRREVLLPALIAVSAKAPELWSTTETEAHLVCSLGCERQTDTPTDGRPAGTMPLFVLLPLLL